MKKYLYFFVSILFLTACLTSLPAVAAEEFQTYDISEVGITDFQADKENRYELKSKPITGATLVEKSTIVTNILGSGNYWLGVGGYAVYVSGSSTLRFLYLDENFGRNQEKTNLKLKDDEGNALNIAYFAQVVKATYTFDLSEEFAKVSFQAEYNGKTYYPYDGETKLETVVYTHKAAGFDGDTKFRMVTINAGDYIVLSSPNAVIHGEEINATDQVAMKDFILTKGFYKANLGFPGFTDDIGYHAIDSDIGDQYHYITEYIALNGRKVSEINADRSIDKTEWTWQLFPSDQHDTFKIPIVLYITEGNCELRIHEKYYENYCAEGLSVTFKKGFSIKKGYDTYQIAEDVTFVLFRSGWLPEDEQPKETNITEEIGVDGYMVNENTYEFRMYFGTHKIFSAIDSYDEGMPLAENILINGKTAKEINDHTDVSEWEWKAFPSDVMEDYHVPVIIRTGSDKNIIILRVHEKFLASLDGPIEITLKSGFERGNGGTYYYTDRDVTFVNVDKYWGDPSGKYTVTYLVNGQSFGDVKTYSYGDSVPANTAEVTPPAGYVFLGWKNEPEKMGVCDVVVIAELEPVVYSVSYMFEGTNSPYNRTSYTVETAPFELFSAEREGYVFEGWYLEPSFETNMEFVNCAAGGNLTLYAKFSSATEPEPKPEPEPEPTTGGGCACNSSSTASGIYFSAGLLALSVLFKIGRKRL